MRHASSNSACYDVQGNLFLPEQIHQAFLLKNKRQSPEDYQLPPGITLKEEVARAFTIAKASWKKFSAVLTRTDLSEDDLRVRTQEFARLFFSGCLGYGNVQNVSGLEAGGRFYPIALLVNGLPVSVAPWPLTLDKTSSELAHSESRGKKSAFQLTQEFLNASDEHLWGFAFSGAAVRLLRDSMSLTRPSYLEFNLREILETEDYHEFMNMWLALHASRAVVKEDATAWDLWIKAGEEAGQPAREAMSYSITDALVALGNGFIAHPSNDRLRALLSSGELSAKDYSRELLRLMYRFLFLFCVEERGLLNTNDGSAENQIARIRYREGYSMHRFRDISRKQRFRTNHHDAWESVRIVFKGLSAGLSALALPALGGLFAEGQCPHLMSSLISNKAFFEAMASMRWATIDGIFAAIDYKNLGTEELGSIYEGWLELVPTVDPVQRTFAFIGQGGNSNERKKTGSYYTPDAFVQNLVQTALDPVIRKRLEQRPHEPEAALLSLRVIDPACGSGHFLLAAARRIAEQLALVRSADGVVTPQSYRLALRDIVQHCIYGVDLNPLAVELARMALWLESFAEGMPLSFLDHHLKVGNSLLGVLDQRILSNWIPSDAYQVNVSLIGTHTTGKRSQVDEKTVVKNLKPRNEKELKAIRKYLGPNKGMADLFMRPQFYDVMKSIETMGSRELSDERAKAKAYDEYVQLRDSDPLTNACNLFMAAFLSPKNSETEAVVPTSGVLFRAFSDGEAAGDKAVVDYSKSVCRGSAVFHWPIEFPLVFADGGFDCVLGNPPWEKAKVEDKKWFANRYPAIADAQTANIRAGMIRKLAEGSLAPHLGLPQSEYQKRTEQQLFDQYQTSLQQAAASAYFCHWQGDFARYPLTGTGDTNLYAYFAELATQLKKQGGTVGLVVPAGMITDDATKQFSQTVFDGHVSSIYHFNNTEKLFPIDSRYSFLLMTLRESEKADCVFYATRLEHLNDKRRHVVFQPGDLKLFNPSTQTCVLVRTEADVELCRKLYRAAPVFVNEADEKAGNPWHLRTMRMFDMANDSDLFHLTRDADDLVPLYEGKLFHQFDNRWATYAGQTDKKGNPVEQDVAREEKANPAFSITPRYWVSSRDVYGRFIDKKTKLRWWHEPWMLAFRDISSPTNERSVIASVLPSAYGAGHTAPLLLPAQDAKLVACLLGNLNSMVVDFVDRIKQSGTHVSFFVLKQLPIFAPSQYQEKDLKFIVPRVAALTRNSDEINTVWLTDYPSYPFQEPRERLRFRAELDAYYARLYGLTRKELQYVLDPVSVMGEGFPSVTFPGLARNETNLYGEYLTQRLVLEAFDKLEAGLLS